MDVTLSDRAQTAEGPAQEGQGEGQVCRSAVADPEIDGRGGRCWPGRKGAACPSLPPTSPSPARGA